MQGKTKRWKEGTQLDRQTVEREISHAMIDEHGGTSQSKAHIEEELVDQTIEENSDKSKDTRLRKHIKLHPMRTVTVTVQQAVSGISTSLSEDSGAEEAKCLPGASSIPQPIESDKDRDSATVESETLTRPQQLYSSI